MSASSMEAGPKGQRILVIDDEPVVGLSCRRVLAPEGHQVECRSDPRAGVEAAMSGGFDVILVDLMMPDIDGLEILKRVKAAGLSSEVVIITGHSTVESAVAAMKEGAADYLSKPFSPSQLSLVLHKVWEHSALIRENAALRRELEVDDGFEGIIGRSRSMERVFSLIRRAAPSDGTVLVTGESGTGKEMVVRAIHRLSRRRSYAFLAFDFVLKGQFENLGDALSGRGGQPQPGDAREAAESSGDQTPEKSGGHRGARSGYSPHRGHQPGSGRNGDRRHSPGGLVLST